MSDYDIGISYTEAHEVGHEVAIFDYGEVASAGVSIEELAAVGLVDDSVEDLAFGEVLVVERLVLDFLVELHDLLSLEW